MMRRALACFALLLATRSLEAQGRALRIEDYYRIQTAGAPVISPDAKWVAFSVTSRVESNNTEPSEVWLVPTNGSRSAQRVSPPGVDADGLQWTDAGMLRFGEGTRGWTVDPANPSTAVEAARSAPRRGGNGSETTLVAPAGGLTATLRAIAPPRRDRTFASDFERRHEERFKGVQFDWLDFQRDGQPFPVPNRADPAVAPPQEVFLTGPGGEHQLTRLGLRPAGLQWNRAGTALLFTADTAYRNERKYGGPAVYVVTTDGNVRTLTNAPEYSHSGASFSPDGRLVLYTRQLTTDAVIARRLNHGGATDLVVRPLDGGPERVLTANWDYLPSQPSWSPDGRHVYFMGGVGGTNHLFRVAVAGGEVEPVTTGERRVNGLSFDKAYTMIAYTVGQIEAPSDVFVARADGTGERRLTNLHAEFTREVALSKAARLQFPSKDGTPIEGWLMYPHGYRADGQRYPLVVSNHGGPHSADGYAFDFKSQYFAANGYFVLKVNFRSSTGYGEKFLWGTWGAWGDRDGEDVMAGVDHAIANYPIDRSRVATIGHSYGGFMTNWLITQYPDRFAAAIPGAGIVNWVSDYGTADIARTKETEFFGAPWEEMAREVMMRQSPLTYAGRVRTPTLFVHGEVDQRVPYSEAEQMYVALKKNGVPAKMIQYAGMPHSISGSWNQVHRAMNELRWLDQYMKSSNTQ